MRLRLNSFTGPVPVIRNRRWSHRCGRIGSRNVRIPQPSMCPACTHCPPESYSIQKSHRLPTGSCIRRLSREMYFFPVSPQVMIPLVALHATASSSVPPLPYAVMSIPSARSM